MEKTYQILKTVLIVLIFIALMLGAWVLYQRLMPAYQPESPTAGEPQAALAPDFTVVDREGNSVNLSDFRGKPVVVNFWASWCGPCKSEMPAFETAYQVYGQDIHFLMVNLTDGSRETVEGAAGFIDGQGYTFPLYFDTTYSAAIAYSVSAIPATYFIDADGHLVTQARGAISEAALEQAIALLLEN